VYRGASCVIKNNGLMG